MYLQKIPLLLRPYGCVSSYNRIGVVRSGNAGYTRTLKDHIKQNPLQIRNGYRCMPQRYSVPGMKGAHGTGGRFAGLPAFRHRSRAGYAAPRPAPDRPMHRLRRPNAGVNPTTIILLERKYECSPFTAPELLFPPKDTFIFK